MIIQFLLIDCFTYNLPKLSMGAKKVILFT